MSFEQQASEAAGAVGKEADEVVGALVTNLETADATILEQKVTIGRKNRRIKRLLARIDELTPDEPSILLAAKPDPNTEANYATSEQRAGVEYPIHRHYATSHDELLVKANACQGEVCAITYEAYQSDGKRLLVIPEKLALLEDTKTIWLGYKHEPEDDIESGRFSLTEFRTAQVRLHDALEVINQGRTFPIVLDLCLQGPWTWRTRNPDDYFVQDVHTQVGTDPYPAFINRAAPYSVTGEQMFGQQLAWANQRGVKLWAAEWGIDTEPTPGARAGWIREMVAYGRANGMIAMSYWDHGSNSLSTDDEFAAAGGV